MKPEECEGKFEGNEMQGEIREKIISTCTLCFKVTKNTREREWNSDKRDINVCLTIYIQKFGGTSFSF